MVRFSRSARFLVPLFCCMMMSLSLWAAPVTVDVPAGSPAKLDGTLDPAFANSPVIETTFVSQGEAKSIAHAQARLVWDKNYLYAYVEVKDSLLNSNNAVAHEQDSVEAFIDETNAKTKPYSKGAAQYRVNYLYTTSGGSGADLGRFKTGA